MSQSLIEQFRAQIPADVLLVVVSKNQPIEAIFSHYQQGQRDFAESRVQAWLDKKSQLPADIIWHFIGPLQRNKVKYLVGKIGLIHSVDQLSLIDEIERCGAAAGCVTPILIQIKIAQEDSKQGFGLGDWPVIWARLQQCPHVQLRGLMGMASLTGDRAQIFDEFSALHKLFVDIQNQLPPHPILSMGMSGDYREAIAAGSNCLRIGRLLFDTASS